MSNPIPSEEDVKQALEAEGIKPSEEVKMESKEVTSEHSGIEKEAMEKGWKPDGPKSAEEFLRAEPLYEELKKRGKQLKSFEEKQSKQDKMIQEMARHIGAMQKAGYETQLEELTNRRNAAVEIGDVEQVEQLEDELYNVKNQLVNQPQEQPELIPEAQEFMESHKDILFSEDPEHQKIQAYVTLKDQELALFDTSPEERMNMLKEDLATKFPTYFGSYGSKQEPVAEGPAVTAVESDATPVRKQSSKELTFYDLTPEQQEICKTLESEGLLTREQYLNQLKDTGVPSYGN